MNINLNNHNHINLFLFQIFVFQNTDLPKFPLVVASNRAYERDAYIDDEQLYSADACAVVSPENADEQ